MLVFKSLFFVCLFVSHCVFAQMSQVSNFGTNPGNLTMYSYQPANVITDAPVVLVMHGCSQSVNDFATETGWNNLADQYGFYVIHAGQNALNNGMKCFNWFSYLDYTRGFGEAMSLNQMVDYMHANYSTNLNRTYVCGLSAGGSMTSVLMASYPEKFHKAGIWAGFPFGYSVGVINTKTPQQWGDLVRNSYSYNGVYPKLFICQGTTDAVVEPENEKRLVDQWTNVHGVDQLVDNTVTSFLGNSNVTQKLYQNAALDDTIVITYTINGMSHGIPVDPGNGTMQGGATAGFSFDVNFFSTYWMADFFGLVSSKKPTLISKNKEEIGSITFNVFDNALFVESLGLNKKMISVYSFSGQLLIQKYFDVSLQMDLSSLSNNANYIAIVYSQNNKQPTSFVFGL